MLNIFENQNISRKSKGFDTALKSLLIYFIAALTALPVYAAQTLFTLKINQDIVQPGIDLKQPDAHVGSVQIDTTTINKLRPGMSIDVPIPGAQVTGGTVINSNVKARASRSSAAAQAATRRMVVSLDNNSGSVEIDLVDNAVTRMLLHDVSGEKIYLANINSNGNGLLRVQDNNEYYCVRYPETANLTPVALRTPQVAEAIPSVNTLRNLESRPGSANVLFIDYWGGSVSGTAWNANFTSNAPINYTAYDTNGNPGSFSSSERYSMWLAWREAVEDFAPFNINVTTSRAVYNAAAVSNRSQMIVTTTSSWYGNAGGVAYVNVFDDNSDYYKVGWTWNLGDRSMGMTISHEAGHQMGLRHDGIGSQSYYQGHGVWGPIMGAPFGKPYVQWSKGEYPNANQSEDDVAKVSGKLGFIADDAGNAYTNATNLTLPVTNKKGLVGFGDTDAYKFTLNSSGDLKIDVIPLLGDEDEARAANLSMNVSLVKINSSGAVISNIKTIRSSDVSPLSPLTNKFVYDASVTAGTYALRISRSSPDSNWATGFGNYGNAGDYRFSISSTTDGSVRTIGKPTIDRATDVGVFIWENSTNKWVINVVSGDKQRIVNVDVSSQQTISEVVPISIESSDVLTQTNQSIDMSLNLAPPWVDGVKFTVQDQASTCVSTTNPDVPIYIGPDRVAMPNGVDLSTLAACNTTPGITTMGKPSINRSTDVGIFIWETAANKWEINVISGGIRRTVDVDVVSQQPLSGVAPLSIESSDVFTQLPASLDMRLNVTPPWMDGVRFTAQEQANTCVSTPSSTVPIIVGPNRVNVGDSINLDTLASCP